MKKTYLACIVLIIACTVALSQKSADTTAVKKKEVPSPEKQVKKDKKEDKQEIVSESSEKPSPSKPYKTDSKSASADTTATKEKKAADTKKNKTEKKEEVKPPAVSAKADTTKEAEKTDDSDDPENPFVTGEEGVTDEAEQEDEAEVPENPFLTGEETVSADESFEEEGVGRIDILIDLGLGMSLSRFFIEPVDISTKGKPGFIFNPGVIIPFAKIFYGSIALRYMQLSVDLSLSLSSVDDSYAKIISKTTTNEVMTFLSVPIKVGMRFEIKRITPYFYVDIEPAYLTGSNQFVSKEVRGIFPDSAEYLIPSEQNTSDINTTDYRERHQIFVGGGIGIEIAYGYGFVYIDGCCQYAIFETDNPDFNTKIDHSVPYRSASRVIYFPVSLGIRFFL